MLLLLLLSPSPNPPLPPKEWSEPPSADDAVAAAVVELLLPRLLDDRFLVVFAFDTLMVFEAAVDAVAGAGDDAATATAAVVDD